MNSHPTDDDLRAMGYGVRYSEIPLYSDEVLQDIAERCKTWMNQNPDECYACEAKLELERRATRRRRLQWVSPAGSYDREYAKRVRFFAGGMPLNEALRKVGDILETPALSDSCAARDARELLDLLIVSALHVDEAIRSHPCDQ